MAAARRLPLLGRSAAARRLRAAAVRAPRRLLRRLGRRRARPACRATRRRRRRSSSCSRGWRRWRGATPRTTASARARRCVDGDLAAALGRCRAPPSTSPSPTRPIARSTKGRRRPIARSAIAQHELELTLGRRWPPRCGALLVPGGPRGARLSGGAAARRSWPRSTAPGCGRCGCAACIRAPTSRPTACSSRRTRARAARSSSSRRWSCATAPATRDEAARILGETLSGYLVPLPPLTFTIRHRVRRRRTRRRCRTRSTHRSATSAPAGLDVHLARA